MPSQERGSLASAKTAVSCTALRGHSDSLAADPRPSSSRRTAAFLSSRRPTPVRARSNAAAKMHSSSTGYVATGASAAHRSAPGVQPFRATRRAATCRRPIRRASSRSEHPGNRRSASVPGVPAPTRPVSPRVAVCGRRSASPPFVCGTQSRSGSGCRNRTRSLRPLSAHSF